MWKDWNAKDLLDTTVETMSFWGKEFKIKRLSIKSVLKIASLVTNLSQWIILLEWEKFNLKALENIDPDELNSIIASILRTEEKEIDELFNVTDFMKLVRIVLKQEDIKKLFLEVRQLTDDLNNQV